MSFKNLAAATLNQLTYLKNNVVAQAASFCGLVKSKSSKLNAPLLLQSFMKVLSSAHVQKGHQNTFNKVDICNTYNSLVEEHNDNCGPKANKATPFTPEGLGYYLDSEGIVHFAKRLVDKAIKKEGEAKPTKSGKALLDSVRIYMPDIKGIQSQDGCYKHVENALASLLKGARSAAKPIQNEDGTTSQAPNAQIGIQTTYCHVTEAPIAIDITSGVASERDSLRFKKNVITIGDAGYGSGKCLLEAIKNGAYFLYKGRVNMKGKILSIKINGKSHTKIYRNLDLTSDLVRNINSKSILDMQVLLTFVDKTKNADGSVSRKTRSVVARVVRFSDKKSSTGFGYVVSNIPTNAPTKLILGLMRVRWGIELFFKHLKSYLGYRAFYTSSIYLTKALVMFSILAYLVQKQTTAPLENKLNKRLSWAGLSSLQFYKKEYTGKVEIPLNKMLTTAYFFLNYGKKEANRLLCSLYEFICNNLRLACKKQQSKQNKSKTLPCLISSLLQSALDDMEESHDMYQTIRDDILIMNAMD